MGILNHLFEPIKIGSMEVKNRIVMSAMGVLFGTENGSPTSQITEYFAARARGGTGMIIAGGLAVSHVGRDMDELMMIWDDNYIPALKKMVDIVHKGTETMFGAQLIHSGRQAVHEDKEAPSPIPSLAVVKGVPRELTLDGIKGVVDSFGDAARRIKESGFDFVEIHGAHGYLISEFLSPNANKRKDEYGGSFENRTRILVEILQNMKEKTGYDFPIGVRINGNDYVEDGWTIEDAKRMGPILEKNGADYIHVSSGVYGSRPEGITIPSMYAEHGCFVHLAEEVKKVVSIPVITVGRIKNPVMADQIIKDGRADMVTMGRAHIVDPNLADKAKSGNVLDIRPCLGCCLGCIESVWKGFPVTCVMNPEVSREYLNLGKDKVEEPKKILVVGAGPAGLAFARTAGLRGHKIIICETEGYVGGMLVTAAKAPGRFEFIELVEYYQRELIKLNIEIRLNVKLDKEMIDSIAPDAVILATGSLPKIPQMEGLLGTDMDVHTVVDVIDGRSLTGDRVIVFGGDMAGLEVADFLSELSKDVLVVEMGRHFAPDMAANDKTYLRERLKRPNVQLFKKVKIKQFLKDGLVFDVNGEEIRKEGFDDLVISQGMRSIRDAGNLFKGSDIEVHFIGDAKEPRSLVDSQTEAFDLGIAI